MERHLVFFLFFPLKKTLVSNRNLTIISHIEWQNFEIKFGTWMDSDFLLFSMKEIWISILSGLHLVKDFLFVLGIGKQIKIKKNKTN